MSGPSAAAGSGPASDAHAGGAVLILGGTGEARALAALLVDRGIPVVSSLAGRVSKPRLPVGEVRVGGFGGVDGLAAYLREAGVRAVVDIYSRTSAIAGWSVVSLLRNLASPVCFY